MGTRIFGNYFRQGPLDFPTEAIAGGVAVVIVLRQDKSQPDNDLLCNLVSFRWPRSEVDQINSLVADAVVNYKAALAAK